MLTISQHEQSGLAPPAFASEGRFSNHYIYFSCAPIFCIN